MSTRRRVAFGVAAALVVVAALAATLALAGGDRGPTRRGAAPVRPGPVLLVPGYGGGTAALEQLAVRLRAAGRQATVVALPGSATGDLRVQARALDVVARAALAAGAPSVDVVGYSAGGVVARLWAKELGGAQRARRIVTLGSPQHGTDLASVAGLLAPSSCPLACQQLASGSELLGRLNQGDETPAGPTWVSIWTAQDTVVTPPDSARLTGARNVVVQQVCAGRQVAHGQLPTDPVVQDLVLRALAARPRSLATATSCS